MPYLSSPCFHCILPLCVYHSIIPHLIQWSNVYSSSFVCGMCVKSSGWGTQFCSLSVLSKQHSLHHVSTCLLEHFSTLSIFSVPLYALCPRGRTMAVLKEYGDSLRIQESLLKGRWPYRKIPLLRFWKFKKCPSETMVNFFHSLHCMHDKMTLFLHVHMHFYKFTDLCLSVWHHLLPTYLLWAKPCNCDFGWHWFKLFVSHSAPYVGLRSEKWRSRPLAGRIADIKESAGHDSEENWEMLTALQCYIMDKGAEKWLMNNLDEQDVWHTLPKAFMHIFTRNCFINVSCVRLSSFRQADGKKNFSRV